MEFGVNMPDKRSHRGAHPDDARLFQPAEQRAALRAAVGDLSWLLTRGYAQPSATKIVGDRYALDARQRMAVVRSACTDAQRAGRLGREVAADALRNRTLLIDGYNLLTTVEVALSGGVLLWARDTTFRDIASMHGSFRKVQETIPALELIGLALHEIGPALAVWYLDQPVSNSGRLKGMIEQIAHQRAWPWEVRVVPNPDAELSSATRNVVASADSVIMDACGAWVSLARWVVTRCAPQAGVVDLRDDLQRAGGESGGMKR